MKKLLLTLCLALSATAGFAQNSATPTNDQSTAAGTSIAGAMRGATGVFVDGELKRNGDNAAQERNNSKSMTSQMDYYKSVTGVSGVTSEGNARNGTIGATAGSSGYFDFSCKTESRSRKSSGGYVFQLEGCSMNGNTVASVNMRMCSGLQKGGSCSEDSNFSAPTVVGSQSYATLDGVQLGLGCNDSTAACRLTVKSSFSMATRTADYEKTIAQKNAATAGDTNTAQNDIVAMRNKKDESGKNAYDASMATDARGMVDCAKTNAERTNAGQAALTCDGKQAVNVQKKSPTAGPPPDCTTSGICVRSAVKTTSFARSCTRTYPLTSQLCEMQTKTKSCEITWVDVPFSTEELAAHAQKVEDNKKAGLPPPPALVPLKTTVSSCSAADIDGAKKFNSEEGSCADTVRPVSGSGNGASQPTEQTYEETGPVASCQYYNRTEYYAWPATPTGACHGDPYTVGGSCNTDPTQVDSQCPANNWFGRTKSATECAMTLETGAVLQVGDNIIAGCGVCPLAKTGTVCYAATPLRRDPLSLTELDRQNGVGEAVEVEDSCAVADLQGCSLTGTDQVANNETGMVTSQRENYTCTSRTESCVEYKQDDRCLVTTVSTFGTEKAGFRAGASDEAMNSALANTAILNSIGGAAAAGKTGVDGNLIVPLLFAGNAQDCEKPTGSWGSNGYYQDCCRYSLERPGKKTGKVNECTEDDARLAAARRANYTVFIGSECSKKTPWPLRKCIRERHVYCAFPGVLPRLIHEQGRKQLAAMAQASSGATTQKAQLNFAYYGTTGTWTNPIKANGVAVAAWQWPAYCNDMSAAAQATSVNAAAKECATRLTNYFAVCDNPAGCGDLPEYPELGSEHWRLTTTDPLQAITTAVSNYAVVTGSCDAGSSQCSYEVSAWPAGVGGRAVVTKQVAFQLYVSQGAETDGEMANIGDYMFKPVSTVVAAGAFPTTLPATVRVNFSSNGGQSWSTLNVPANDNKETTLPGSNAKLSGGCDVLTNLCRFSMTGTATVRTMPWGDVKNPNCAGFTPGQLSVLDFGKMDLSEWMSTVSANIQGPDKASMVASTASQTAQYNQNFQSGSSSTMTVSAPTGASFALLTPPEGFGPFDTTLKVAGYWPATTGDPARDTDAVTGVSVDWGDCTSGQALSFVGSVGGQAARGFQAGHRYTRPQDVPAACGGGERNLTHIVKLRVSTTKSGVKDLEIKVKNAYNTMPGAYTSNVGGSINTTPSTSTSVPATTVPPPGK
jgi:hypothetical protein